MNSVKDLAMRNDLSHSIFPAPIKDANGVSKRGIVLYLHIHQPRRLRPYTVFDTAINHDYFDDEKNEQVFRKVADKSYRPMNKLLVKMLDKYPDFKFSLSITGSFLEQAEKWAPDVLESFKDLVKTERVEIVAETYNHSLAFFHSRKEFEYQVKLHKDKIHQLFGVATQVFRNTELSYNDEMAKWAEDYGFKGILAEGWDPILEWRSPNCVYRPAGTTNISLLLKNYRLSDDVAFRFSDTNWKDWPLSADKYTEWVNMSADNQSTVNLFMDYETFGEHQWHDTGIFDFYETFIGKWLENPVNTFYTVSGAIDEFKPVGEISMSKTITWADTERDLTAWNGNSMQREALRYIYAMEDDILRTKDQNLIDDWRRLQTSDHFYYMCTKYFADGDVHAYFSPYESPYDAFLYFLNVIRDLRWRLHRDHHTGGLNG